MSIAPADYVCPNCYARSCFATTCNRCETVRMIPQSQMPTTALRPVREVASTGFVRLPAVSQIESPFLLGLMGALIMLFGVGLLALRFALPGASDVASIAIIALAAAINLAFCVRPFHRFSVWRSQRRVVHQYRDVPRSRITNARDGLVRVAGVGQLLSPHPTSAGVQTLAHRTAVSVPLGSSGYRSDAISDAGSFALCDGSGTNAFINTAWVEVVGPARFDGSITIPAGAAIEVVGLARRVPIAEASNGGVRNAPEVLEFIGTPEQRVMIRLIDPEELTAISPASTSTTTQAHAATSRGEQPTGVRVAFDESRAPDVDAAVARGSIPSMHRSVRV